MNIIKRVAWIIHRKSGDRKKMFLIVSGGNRLAFLPLHFLPSALHFYVLMKFILALVGIP